MKIRWTQQAAEDLKAAYEYLNERSPTAADSVVERILSSIDFLEHYPHLGRSGRIDDTRELVVTGTPFIVGYRLRHDQIEILGVLHAARKWPKKF